MRLGLRDTRVAIDRLRRREHQRRGGRGRRVGRERRSRNERGRGWRDAEQQTAEWLSSRRETAVLVGSGTKDGGVDVETTRYVVQVRD